MRPGVVSDPKIAEEGSSVGGEKHVCWLDVAVDESGAMGGIEGIGDRSEEPLHVDRVERSGGAESVSERARVGEVEHEGDPGPVGDHLTNTDHVRMAEAGEGLGLASQSLLIGNRVRDGQPFHGDVAGAVVGRGGVSSPPHRASGPTAKQRQKDEPAYVIANHAQCCSPVPRSAH